MSSGFVKRAVLLAVITVVLVGVRVVTRTDPYELTFVMPTADNTFVGANVTIDGEKVGEVTDIGVRDGSALVTVQVDEDHAPLHAGTTVRIDWESLIGARVVELIPGKVGAPALESGRLIVGSAVEAVELDNVLATLDSRTRAKLQVLIAQLNRTVEGRGAEDVNELIGSTAPLTDGAAKVVKAVAKDGPAIRELVDQLHALAGAVAGRDRRLSSSVVGLNQVTGVVADRQSELSRALAELPTTLDNANATLAAVPGPVDKTGDLLAELRPATKSLPHVSAQLSPVMRDLRPAVAELRPTLTWLSELLQYTPGLLSVADQTVPGATTAVTSLRPMVSFLRPYTPELTGWLANWTSIFGSQAAAGNYARALITVGASSFNNNPGAFVPGQSVDPTPGPGSIVDQPWDANGDGMR